MKRMTGIAILTAGLCVSCNENRTGKTSYGGWTQVNGNADGNKYSSLAQIDTGNATQLRVAWEFHTGDMDTAAHSQIQCNPVMVDGTLYLTSPMLKVFALDAATGKQKWMYSPYDSIGDDKNEHFILNNNRGVTYWTDGKGDTRIFYAAGAYLVCLDAATGKPVTGFGREGRIDLHDGLEMEGVADLFVTETTPPAVYKDLLLCGTRVSEGMDAAPGDIRAYNAKTGKRVWQFHTIPHPGEAGYETWEDRDAYKYTGGANNWMGMTIDQQRGIAYIPIGSAAMDFYGGKRKGANLFSDCLLALDAATGKEKWHFQYLHHDTWDYDPSSAPVLLTLTRNGRTIDAVAQTTKTGFVYVFDRDSGEPLFPVAEKPVDTLTGLTGEKMWPTQPVPEKPAPFVRQSLTQKDINPYLSGREYDSLYKVLGEVHTGRLFTPQSKEGTIIFPGFDGGAEYGGPAVDPETGVLYVNGNEMAWILRMLPADTAKRRETFRQAGLRLYKANCMSCHGPDRKGSGNYPSIAEADKKLNRQQFISFINAGRRMMPAFRHLPEEDKEAIASYVLNQDNEKKRLYTTKLTAIDSFRLVPYQISGYNRFNTKSGLPGIAPPWGVLNAINLNTGKYLWKQPFGSGQYAGAPANTGCENYGGAVVTRGGLLLIGAAKDGMFRVYNKRTGALLWQTQLPAAAFATPATYEIAGKQYIVIACGGGKLGTKSGDSYVAFALPGKE